MSLRFFSLIAGVVIRNTVWNQKRKVSHTCYLLEKQKQLQTHRIRTLNQLLLQLQNWNNVELKQVAEKWPCSIPWSIIVQLKHLCLRLLDFRMYFCTLLSSLLLRYSVLGLQRNKALKSWLIVPVGSCIWNED